MEEGGPSQTFSRTNQTTNVSLPSAISISSRGRCCGVGPGTPGGSCEVLSARWAPPRGSHGSVRCFPCSLHGRVTQRLSPRSSRSGAVCDLSQRILPFSPFQKYFKPNAARPIRAEQIPRQPPPVVSFMVFSYGHLTELQAGLQARGMSKPQRAWVCLPLTPSWVKTKHRSEDLQHFSSSLHSIYKSMSLFSVATAR